MLGYFENKNVQGKHYLLASTLGGLTARAVSQPLDVVSIRLQLQVEPISSGSEISKYKGSFQALRLILKEEGAGALWKGHVPAQGLSFYYGAFQFGLYEKFTKLAYHKLQLDPSHTVSFVSGGMAGGIATMISYPFDLFRTRFAAQGKYKVYQGILHAKRMFDSREGNRFYFRGLQPALLYTIPQAGLQFGFYSIFTSLCELDNAQTPHHISIEKAAACGAAAGTLSKALVYPLDLVKKRTQIQGFYYGRIKFGEFPVAATWLQSIKKTLEKEAILGFYKGYLPSLFKAAIVSGISFSIYEEICYLISIR